MILAGDIGGTSTRIGIFEFDGTRPVLRGYQRFPSKEQAGLEDIVRSFREQHSGPLAGACFGIAGPVLNGQVVTPNLPWVVDAAALSAVTGGSPVWLLNDLEANAYGTFTLRAPDFQRLNPDAQADPQGNLAIISAGTGLGEAGIMFDGRYLRPLACEGGHAGFAPENGREADLWRFLSTRFDRVSAERTLSGPGLHNVYEFLRDTRWGVETEEVATELRQAADSSAVITQAALAGRSKLCSDALDLFVSIYGAEAGNLALKLKATRGVFVGGGIAPRILPRLKAGPFLPAFAAKGRLRPMLEAIPIDVILNDQAALLGAALYGGLKAGLTQHPELAV